MTFNLMGSLPLVIRPIYTKNSEVKVFALDLDKSTCTSVYKLKIMQYVSSPSSGKIPLLSTIRMEVNDVTTASLPVQHACLMPNHCRLLVTADVVPSSQILVTLTVEPLRSSETSVLTRTTRHNIPEDGIPLNLFPSTVEGRETSTL
jgi:hypothetical protein